MTAVTSLVSEPCCAHTPNADGTPVYPAGYAFGVRHDAPKDGRGQSMTAEMVGLLYQAQHSVNTSHSLLRQGQGSNMVRCGCGCDGTYSVPLCCGGREDQQGGP
jgi:hypothetical protein